MVWRMKSHFIPYVACGKGPPKNDVTQLRRFAAPPPRYHKKMIIFRGPNFTYSFINSVTSVNPLLDTCVTSFMNVPLLHVGKQILDKKVKMTTYLTRQKRLTFAL